MVKKFLKDSFYYTIPSFFSRGLSIFLIPLYTKVLSPANYGMLDLFLAYLAFVNMTITLDIVSGLARFYIGRKNNFSKSVFASTALYFTFICYTIFIIFNIFFFDEISRFIIGVNGNKFFFKIGLVYLWFNGITYVLTNQLRFDSRSKDYAKVTTFNSLVTVISSFVFVILFDLKLIGIILGYLFGSIFTFTHVMLLNKNVYKFAFSNLYLKQMLKFSFPLLFSGISVWVNLFMDRIILNHFVTLEQVGLFGIGSRLSSIAGIFIIGVQSSLGPLIYEKHEETETSNKIAKIFRYFIFLSIVGYILLCLYSDEILRTFTTNAYLNARTVIYFLIPASILSQIYFIFAPGPWIYKNSKFVMLTNILGAFFNIFLNLLLVPNFGIIGAAISTLLTHLLIFTVNMIYSQKLYMIPYQWLPIFYSIIFAVSSIIFFNYISITGVIKYILSILLILIFLIFSLQIKLINISELKSLKLYIFKRST